MTGRALFIGFLVALAVFTAALWYFQTYAFYEDIDAPEGGLMGRYPVETWAGIDATSSPLKKRVCLTVTPETAQKIADDEFELTGGEPLVAPYWFDCFDAAALAADLAAGRAQLYSLGQEVAEGVDEYLALYADGRGFIWRQLDPRFRTQ